MADIKISQLGEALAVTDNDILPMTASGVTSKVKASTMKSYMVDDLDISDLHDTTITTPTDDDGLVYDATAQKWKNVPIMTKEQWKKNGAYNLCPNNITSQAINAVTFTVRSDGSIYANGTASGDITLPLAENIHLSEGKYVLVGGNNASQFLYLGYGDGSWHAVAQTDSLDSTNFEITTERNNFAAGIFISSGQVVDFVFKPMITTDLNATYDDYVPYAKTNRELTDLKTDNALLWTDPSNISSISSFASINDGFWSIGSADVARMTDKPTGMSDTKVYIICRNDGSSSLFNILISPKDNHVYVRFKYTSSWSSWVTIA